MAQRNGKQINRALGNIMHGAGWLMVFGFTGTCTVLLIQKYAPPSFWWLPWFGLGVFEFGAVHWLHYHQHNARNALQFIVGLLMTVVSVVAITCATGTEMLTWFAASGVISISAWIEAVVFYAIIGVFILNVIAFVACRLAEPEHVAMWRWFDIAGADEDARSLALSAPAPKPVVITAEPTPSETIDAVKSIDSAPVDTPAAPAKKIYTIKGKQYTVDDLVRLADTLIADHFDTESFPVMQQEGGKKKAQTKA